MELKSSFYPVYLSEPISNIPTLALTEIIEELSSNVKFYMNSDLDSTLTDRLNNAIVSILQNRYKYFTLSIVAEAFQSGSLGELGGTTKFTVRNVAIWLNASREKSERLRAEQTTKQDNMLREQELNSFKSKQKRANQYARAFLLKLEWTYESKRFNLPAKISFSDWDKYTLDSIVEKFDQGFNEETLMPSMI